MQPSQRVSSCIPGLDDMLQGGLPEGRVVLVVGEPGSGKTILAFQFVAGGVLQGEPGVFVCLDESKEHLQREMRSFGWDLGELEKAGLAFVDASPLRLLPEKVRVGLVAVDRKEFTMSSLTDAVLREANRVLARRVAVDSVTSLMLQYTDPLLRRDAVLDLIAALVKSRSTCIITLELKQMGFLRNLEVEEYLSHGVILLRFRRVGRSLTRVLRITKMREVAVDTQPRPYEIGKKGLEVYPKESIF